jgi:small-conductance mechanosensitive channel
MRLKSNINYLALSIAFLPKHLKMMRFFRISSIFIFLFILGSGSLFAQDSEPTPTDSTDTRKALSIDEISSETETLRHRISSLEKVLKPSSQALEVDSILDTVYVEIIQHRDSLYVEMEGLTKRSLKIRSVRWMEYKSKLKSLQSVLNDRSVDITDVNDELELELNKWSYTKEELLKNSESEDVFSSLDTMILTLDGLIDLAHVRLDSVFTIQKRLTELVLIVDEANSEIERIQRQKQLEYFTFDSDPLWRKAVSDSVLLDSALMVENPFIKGLKADASEFETFVSRNLNTVIFQVISLLILLVAIYQVRVKSRLLKLDDDNPIEQQAKKILDSPIASTTVVGILMTSYFYEALIPVFAEVSVTLVLLATLVLLPQITINKIRLFIFFVLGAYLIQVVGVYFEEGSSLLRWIMIFESLMLLFGLQLGRRIVLENSDKFKSVVFVFKYIAPLYLFVLVTSVITNAIGMVNLAVLLTNGVLQSVALGMVVLVAIRVVTSLMVLFFKLRDSNKVQPLSVMVKATSQRFQPVLIWVGMILWVFFTLNGFDVYTNIVDWAQEILQITWHIGDTRISLGAILSFIFLFVVSLLLAKFMAAIFQDDWMIGALPRGVAPAISLLLRITIITVGLYLAFTSAGFDLSELGFVFGALGVGIGFGLQNVVLNFIAGLILAFERPINLGDTIVVDQEMGVVTNIGVRSSNIKTYSGAEAIIPNGDLISKKVVNWTLHNRDRRSRILMKTAGNANPERVIELFNGIASGYSEVFSDPEPKTYFYGYTDDGNLSFSLLYWTTFSDTLKTDSAIALDIFKALKEEGIEAPMTNQRNFK